MLIDPPSVGERFAPLLQRTAVREGDAQHPIELFLIQPRLVIRLH